MPEEFFRNKVSTIVATPHLLSLWSFSAIFGVYFQAEWYQLNLFLLITYQDLVFP